MVTVDIKYFNALIDNRPFFYHPIKTNKKHSRTRSNGKKHWLYKKKCYALFVPSNIQ